MSGVAAGAAQRESSARPLRRPRDDRVLAGVCAGIARWLGVDPIIVRVAFVAAAAAGGLGFLLYAIAAVSIPEDAVSEPAGTSAPTAGRWYVVAGVASLALSLLLFARELGIWFTDALVWPVVLAAAGAALLWHRSAATAAVESPSPIAMHRRPLPLGRIAAGIALVLGAGLLFLVANDALSAARDVALTAFAVAIALALILAPLWWRLVRNLAAERRERIRTQERAELAAHLHDSVLQTLAPSSIARTIRGRLRASRDARSESCARGLPVDRRESGARRSAALSRPRPTRSSTRTA